MNPVAPAVSGQGAIAHPAYLVHSEKFRPRAHKVNDRVWCAVGFGLSNVTLVLGDEGAILIDSGECNEEMAEAIESFGAALDRPVVAVICSHSHYISGTAEVLKRWPGPIRIYAHQDVAQVMADVGAEIGPAYMRRLKVQFGYDLPRSGPDSMPNLGLGPFMFREGVKTPGFLEPTDLVPAAVTELRIAGLQVRLDGRYPSDSRDTLIIDFPELKTVVNNHVWPCLFNIYPLRGELYRDPLVMVHAVDEIRAARPEYLVGVHGLPVIGGESVRACLNDYRDSIQYLWDQTVRGINAALTPDELAATIELPPRLRSSPWVQPFYGETPYHVRAIHNGLFGWFGGDTATLHPVAPRRRAQLLVAGLGGRDKVLAQAREAVGRDEHSWAAELCAHLLQLDPSDSEAAILKATVLRHMAQRTTAANTRAFLLEEARRLEAGKAGEPVIPVRPVRPVVMRSEPGRFLRAIAARLDPARSANADTVLRLTLEGTGVAGGLHVIGGVGRFIVGDPARTAEPARVDLGLSCDKETWALLLAGRQTLAQAIESGRARMDTGAAAALLEFFDLFDNLSLR
ncbi:MAG TPA: alkyl sulfatase dimerization domain-containing protein [Burkholderiaceae bacterium]|nr:alkyl sulfatase dimerization domain-containing protein [Burkholderiaceae bacterium]